MLIFPSIILLQYFARRFAVHRWYTQQLLFYKKISIQPVLSGDLTIERNIVIIVSTPARCRAIHPYHFYCLYIPLHRKDFSEVYSAAEEEIVEVWNKFKFTSCLKHWSARHFFMPRFLSAALLVLLSLANFIPWHNREECLKKWRELYIRLVLFLWDALNQEFKLRK